jgi:triosephosphate isomerase
MLQELGCRYVLVGHSERRTLYGETNQDVAAKFRAAMSVGLTPVLCVGESLEEREADQTSNVVAKQIQAVINEVGLSSLTKGVVAYEPVWAIGTGRTATPEQVSIVHQDIRSFVGCDASEASQDISEDLRIIYGGSVKPENAFDLFSLSDVDGGLIGGASLHSEGFGAIAGALAEAYGLLADDYETH